MKPPLRLRPTLLPLSILLMAACVTPQATAGTMEISLQVDDELRQLTLPAGSTVQFALDQAGIELGQLDLINPPGYTVLTDGATIEITRRSERFEIEEVVIPFARQTVQNEGLPVGETRLLQPGENGLEEITYRIVEEDGLDVSRQAVKRSVVLEPRPEIIMIGAQAIHTPVAIEGTLAFLSAGNAWVIQGDSTNRLPIVVSGDLDGQVFRLSPDGEWLLYSRGLEDEGEDFNALWVHATEDPDADPIDLGARNVVHFADWSPEADSNTLAYSTVEPRPSAPGWQANNDLILTELRGDDRSPRMTELLPANAGGQYGWWGTSFAWAPDGVHMAYARADGIGVIDLREPQFEPTYSLLPYQTQGDWAWVPGIAWGHNSRTLYVVDHGEPLSLEDPATSPIFDLIAIGTPGTDPIRLVQRTGMFAYPSLSPPVLRPTGELAFQVAFLQALDPLESENSSYSLVVMDRDGSNRRVLFPLPGEPGITAEYLTPPVWSPSGERIAFIHRGDLWVVEVLSGDARPLTGDGQTVALDWRP